MKVKSTVLLGLILFICLLCGVSLMARLNSKQDEWRPSDIYSTLGGSRGNYFTTVSYGAGASSATSMPVLSHSGSLFNHGAAFSYAHAGVSINQSPVTNTAAPQGGLYLTSSAEVRTFGGGSNAVVSVNGGSAQMAPVSPIASVNGMNMSSSLSTASQLAAGAGLQMPTGELAMASTSTFIDVAGVANGGGARSIGSRRNAPGIGGNLDEWIQGVISGGYGTVIDGVYHFNYYDLYDLYLDAINNGQLPSGVSWEQFLSWFDKQGGYAFMPISDGVCFLCLLALVYAVVIIRKKKLAKQL